VSLLELLHKAIRLMLDWDGGTGDYLIKLKAMVPSIEVEYHCKELPLTCDIGKSLNSDVIWHEEDDSWTSCNFDLVFSSGAFYYVKDWKEILKKFTIVEAPYIFITRTPVVEGNDKSFVVKLEGSDGNETLFHVLNKNEIINFFENNGYALEREFLTGEVPQIDNCPFYVESKGWLFVKK